MRAPAPGTRVGLIGLVFERVGLRPRSGLAEEFHQGQLESVADDGCAPSGDLGNDLLSEVGDAGRRLQKGCCGQECNGDLNESIRFSHRGCSCLAPWRLSESRGRI